LNILNQNKICYTYKKGDVIFQEGTYPHGVFCVRSGKIKILKHGLEGKDQLIRFSKGGDLIGYRALLSGEPYSSSAVCLDETLICFIPKDIIIHLISQYSGLAFSIMQRACHELGEAAKLITNMAQKSNRERLAEMILVLKTNFGLDSDGAIDVKLSREELASMVGTATESLIRILSDFKEEGLIDTIGKKIKPLNVKGIIKTARLSDLI